MMFQKVDSLQCSSKAHDVEETFSVHEATSVSHLEGAPSFAIGASGVTIL
jgi:hypothetical protein